MFGLEGGRGVRKFIFVSLKQRCITKQRCVFQNLLIFAAERHPVCGRSSVVSSQQLALQRRNHLQAFVCERAGSSLR